MGLGIEELLADKRDEILAIAQKHGAYNVRVFGSVARGEADDQSDVDFLVEMGKNRSSWFPVGLIQDLEDLLGREVDVATEKMLHERIRDRVLKEAISL
ncbi:nucleotidyltransferase family protein [Leptolyngbya sp. AN03gr2]|uniref:nucleotidyltransferase family protein n=1 Tax=unclassified Leptolyngbya TaxID=2650499 RepID=UPI003D3196D6